MDRKDYGSVLIHLKKGEITGITEKNDYNCDAFVDTVTKPVNTVIVRSYKAKRIEKHTPEVTELSESDQKVTENDQTVTENDRKMTEDK